MKKAILITLALFFYLGAGAQDNKTKVRIISEDPVIHLDREILDFGTIERGSDPIRTFKVINRGGKPLLLTNCSGSCGCTVPKCPREPIMSGEMSEITVRYDTNRLGAINKSVTIKSNDPHQKAKIIRVKGTVTAKKTTTGK